MNRAAIISLVLVICLTGTVRGESSADSFLTDTAGMMAYFQFTGPTNLASNLLHNQFRAIDGVTSSYIIGSVQCDGYTDSSLDAKVMVHNDGWVVAYFDKYAPVSRVVDLKQDPVTRLDKVLSKMAYALDVDTYTISYTHAQHQEATALVRVARSRGEYGEATMDVRLPAANSYYAQAWHLRIQNSLVHGWFKLDQRELGGTPYGYGSTAMVDGGISSSDLVPNARHVITVGISNSGWGYSYAELDLLMSGTTPLSLTNAEWIYSMPMQPIPQGLSDAAQDVPRYYDTFLPAISR